jgi:hypothetical protein
MPRPEIQFEFNMLIRASKSLIYSYPETTPVSKLNGIGIAGSAAFLGGILVVLQFVLVIRLPTRISSDLK